MKNNISLRHADEDDTTVYVASLQRLMNFSYEFAVCLLVFNFLIIFATFFGNSTVLLLLKVHHQLRVPANYLLANLAVVGLLDALVLQVTNADAISSCVLRLRNCQEPAIITKDVVPIFDVFGLTILYANVSTLCLITTDRYIAIKHSLKYHLIVTPQRVRIAIAGSWVSGVVLGVAAAFLFPIQSGRRIVPEAILTIGAIFMVVFYVKISKISRFHRKKIRAQQMAVDPNTQHIKRELRGLKTLALLSISLFASYLPLTICGLEKTFFNSDLSEFRLNAREAFRQTAILLLFTKSAVNPMLYFFRNALAREYTFKMYTSVKEKLLCR